LVFDPRKERLLVDEHAPARAPHDPVEAIALRVEHEVPKATEWRPGMILVPLREGDQPRTLTRGFPVYHLLLHDVPPFPANRVEICSVTSISFYF